MGKKVKVASFGLNETFLRGKTQEQIIPVVLDKIESVRGYKPDLIVLPEAYLKIGGDIDNPNWIELTKKMLAELSRLAREMNCYIAAPLYEPYLGQTSCGITVYFFWDATENWLASIARYIR